MRRSELGITLARVPSRLLRYQREAVIPPIPCFMAARRSLDGSATQDGGRVSRPTVRTGLRFNRFGRR